MTNDTEAGNPSQHPKSEKAHRLAPADAALAIELLRFDPRERVPEHRRAIRNKAKAIIEGRQRWPAELFPWQHMRELEHFRDGKGSLPPWHDPRNMTRPQRERRRLADEAWRKRQSAIVTSGEHPTAILCRVVLEAPRWRGGHGMGAIPKEMLDEAIFKIWSRRQFSDLLWKVRFP